MNAQDRHGKLLINDTVPCKHAPAILLNAGLPRSRQVGDTRVRNGINPLLHNQLPGLISVRQLA